MSRPEKVQPNDYPKWMALISDIPRKEGEPQKEYVKRLCSYAVLHGLPEISDKIYVPLAESTDYEHFLLLKNGEKDQLNDDDYSAEDPTVLDPYDREYRLTVLNVLNFLIEKDELDDAAMEKKKENLKRSITQVFLKEADR